GARRRDPGIDSEGSGASLPRGILDGEFDDRAVEDRVAVAANGGAGAAATREREESGVCGTLSLPCCLMGCGKMPRAFPQARLGINWIYIPSDPRVSGK